MDAVKFLERVIPANGYIFVGQLTKAKTFWHRVFDKAAYSEAAQYMLSQANKGDVYIALGGFREKLSGEAQKPRRKADNVAMMKSFYADLDVGDDKPFKTKEEALGKLVELVQAGKLPRPSIIIDSGGGIHVYWTLDVATSLQDWLPVAMAFKTYMLDTLKFGIDKAVTADPARVLRAPDTINHKRNRRVRALRLDGPDYSLEHIRDLVGELPAGLMPRGPAIANDEFASGVPAGVRAPAYMSRIVERCPAMAQVLANNGADQDEPFWMATLHLASFCEDGREMAHELSRGHATYSEAGTDYKYDQRLEVDRDVHGPTTCEKFSEFSSACASCQYFSKIKSPIVLGSKSELARIPPGYRIDDGLLYKLVEEKDADGNGVATLRQVTWFQLGKIELTLEDGATVMSVQWRPTAKHGWRITIIQFGDLANDLVFGRAVSEVGMNLQTPAMKDFRGFMVSFSTLLQQHSAAPVRQEAPFGWASESGKLRFGLGDVALVPGGEEPLNASTSRSILAQYAPTGSYEEWKTVSDFLCGQGHLPLLTIYATAYAAPLMEFIGLPGVIVSAMSPGSGLGKSSALQLAASVYGDPLKTVHAVDDTTAMISRKMAMTPGLPAYWDEVRMRHQMEKLRLHLFRVSQGKDKSRLRADTSFNFGQTWSTLMLVCSNTSLFDCMLRDGGGEAGFYRVFEYEVTAPPPQDVDKMVAMFAKLRKNNGHAGRRYARYLVDNYDAIKARCGQVAGELAAELGAERAERFWCGAMTALIVGAETASKAGVASFDPIALRGFLCENFRRLRGMESNELAEELDPGSTVDHFLSQANSDTLVTDIIAETSGVAVRIKHHPSRSLLAQKGVDDGKIRIVAQAFHDYLQSRGLSASGTIKRLVRERVLSEKHRRPIGAGTNYARPRQQWCYDVLAPVNNANNTDDDQ